MFRNKAGDRELTIYLQWTEKKEIILSGIKRGNSVLVSEWRSFCMVCGRRWKKREIVDATTIGYKKIIDLQGVENRCKSKFVLKNSRVAPVISFVGVY